MVTGFKASAMPAVKFRHNFNRFDGRLIMVMARALRLMLISAGPLMLPAVASAESTLGFVITTWHNAIYETKFIDECPTGLAEGNHFYWWNSTSWEERAELTQDGLTNRPERLRMSLNRGRNGADICMDPTSIDAPPLRTVKGSISFGMNLDENIDGEATANTCKHENFTSPEGEPGIDNQFYRVVGCIHAYRSVGYFFANPNESRKMQSLAIILMEVKDVDNPRNDDSVEVTFYRSIDGYAVDSTSQFVGYGSYRIDTFEGKPRYGDTVKGKIVDGVLTTEPADVMLPYFGNYTYQQMRIRDMRMEFVIDENEETSTGLLAGYYDVELVYHQAMGIGGVHSNAFISCPGLFETANKYADGYPDPETGKCTALSAAWHIQAVPAHIIHPLKPQAPRKATAPDEQGLWDKVIAFMTD